MTIKKRVEADCIDAIIASVTEGKGYSPDELISIQEAITLMVKRGKIYGLSYYAMIAAFTLEEGE